MLNRSHGVNGAVALANVAALSVSTIATPPEPSANPQKPLNSKPSGGFHCEKKARLRWMASSLLLAWNSRRVEQHRTSYEDGTIDPTAAH